MIGYLPPESNSPVPARPVPAARAALYAPLPDPPPFVGTPEQEHIVASTGWLRGYLGFSVVVCSVLLVIAGCVVAFQSMTLPYLETLKHVALLIMAVSIVWGIRQAKQGLEHGDYSALTLVAVMMWLPFIDEAWGHGITLADLVPAVIASVVLRSWLRVSRARFVNESGLAAGVGRRLPFYLRRGVASVGLSAGWLGLTAGYFDSRAVNSGEVIVAAVPLGPRLQFGYASRESLTPFIGRRVMVIIVWRRKVEPPSVDGSLEQQRAGNQDFDDKWHALLKRGWTAEGPGDALMVHDPKNHALVVGGKSIPVQYHGPATVVLVETSGWPIREKVVGITSVPAPLSSDVQSAEDFRALLQKSPVAADFIR